MDSDDESSGTECNKVKIQNEDVIGAEIIQQYKMTPQQKAAISQCHKSTNNNANELNTISQNTEMYDDE